MGGDRLGDQLGDERGTATLWILGLCVAVMFLGGLGLDLWRGITTRRELSGLADAAATAGANGVEEAALRSGAVQLDETRVREIAFETLRLDDRAADLDAITIDVVGDEVVVTLQDEVPFSLLGIFVQGEPFTVRATARARPQARP